MPPWESGRNMDFSVIYVMCESTLRAGFNFFLKVPHLLLDYSIVTVPFLVPDQPLYLGIAYKLLGKKNITSVSYKVSTASSWTQILNIYWAQFIPSNTSAPQGASL